MLVPGAGAIHAMDRAHVGSGRSRGSHQGGAFFATRARSSLNAHRVYPAVNGRAAGVTADQTIAPDGHYTAKACPAHLRRARLKDPETGKTLIFLTNQTALPALTICGPRKSRWRAERFFKWIRQRLRIKKFHGTSGNAVKTRIWIAAPVHALAAIVRKQLKLEAALRTLTQVFSVTVFEKAPIEYVILQTADGSEPVMDDNRLNLFGV